MQQDDELVAFSKLPIHALAEAFGWTHDPSVRDSRVSSKSLPYRLGDRVVTLWQGRDGTWMWTGLKGATILGKSSGTIVHIAREHCGGNLGDARKILRGLSGRAPVDSTPPTNPPSSPARSSRVADVKPVELRAVEPEAPKLTPDQVFDDYLNGTRELGAFEDVPAYLKSRGIHWIPEGFIGSFRMTDSGALAVPYVCLGADGKLALGGVERKGTGYQFPAYSKNGTDGVWIGGHESSTIIVVEHMLDAISYEIIHRPKAMYVAVRSGRRSMEAAVHYIKGLIEGGGVGLVECATDNDPAGMRYAADVWEGLGGPKRSTVSVRYNPPAYMDSRIKDWNDVLQRMQAEDSDELVYKHHQEHYRKLMLVEMRRERDGRTEAHPGYITGARGTDTPDLGGMAA